MNVSHQLKQIGVAIAENRLVASLKQVAHRAMATVVSLGVGELDRLHDFGKRYLLGLQQQVHVVGHQNVCVDYETAALPVMLETLKIRRAVLVITKNYLPLIAPYDDMIESPFKLDS